MNATCLNFWKMQIKVDYECKQRLKNKIEKQTNLDENCINSLNSLNNNNEFFH